MEGQCQESPRHKVLGIRNMALDCSSEPREGRSLGYGISNRATKPTCQSSHRGRHSAQETGFQGLQEARSTHAHNLGTGLGLTPFIYVQKRLAGGFREGRGAQATTEHATNGGPWGPC